MAEDRKQIGLTEDAHEKVVILAQDTPYFGEEGDVYRLAVAVGLALNAQISPNLRNQSFRTKWRALREDGADDDISPRLDSADQKLARLIALFRPELAEEPYRNSQYLAVAGISYLYVQLIEKTSTLQQLIEDLIVRSTDDEAYDEPNR